MGLLEQRLAPLQQQHGRHEQGPHHRDQNNVGFRLQSEDSDCWIDTNISSVFTLRDNEDLSDRNMM